MAGLLAAALHQHEQGSRVGEILDGTLAICLRGCYFEVLACMCKDAM